MKKFVSNNGITLIALMITIIGMLILAAVIMSIARNDGIIGKTDEATRLAQKTIDKEELQLEIVVVKSLNKKNKNIELSKLATNLEEKGWKVTVSEDNAICTSQKENSFTVDKEGKIIEGEIQLEEKSIWSILGLQVNTNVYYEFYNTDLKISYVMNFTDDGKLIIKENNKELEPIDATDQKNIDSNGNLAIAFTYNKTTYPTTLTMNSNGKDIEANLQEFTNLTFVKIDNEKVYSNEEVLKRLGITNYTGTYTGTWEVIGEENGKTKLVSTRDVTRYRLGYEEQKAIDAIPAVGNEPTEMEKIKRSIWSYQNAISTLNTLVQEATGGIAGARSVNRDDIEGIISVDKGTKYGKIYTYNYTNQKDQIFVDDNNQIVEIKTSDDTVILEHNYYTYDLSDDDKVKIGSLANGYYWLASPTVDCHSDDANYYVSCINNGGINNLLFFRSSGAVSRSTSGVRAIILI